jgi:hypothetical protein
VAARRDETEHERLDRQLDELTGELRVVVTGVQVLFAFLLIVPFNTGFKGIGPFERTVYLVTLPLASVPFLVLWFAIPIRRAAELGREQRRRGAGEDASEPLPRAGAAAR